MPPEDDIGSLERARERLYAPEGTSPGRTPLSDTSERTLPHAWQERILRQIPHEAHHVRFAALFFMAAIVFFIAALVIAGYFFLFGGNSVSVDKIAIDIQGPTSISGGDIVPLSLTISNKNSTVLANAVLEIDFPNGTRDASNVQQTYPRYTETLGEIQSGANITRSVKAVIFGNAGESVSFPVALSYEVAGSNAVFVKKVTYSLTVATTPLSVSVDTLSETVSGKPLTFTLTVRSNSTIALPNVVLEGNFPFGFSVISSSVPMTNSSFLLGTLLPGGSKTITLVGSLTGQDREQRVFHFTVGTASGPSNQTLAVRYMTQDASVSIAAPFIDTVLSINGNTSNSVVLSPGTAQNVSASYTNTLDTSIENATIAIAISGTAVDYNSIRSSSGFYRSSDHTVVFSSDTDPSLAELAPGASGIGAFSFSTLPAGSAGPSVQFTVSVSGTRVGQTHVPEQVTASLTKTVKVATVIALAASASHSAGPINNSGPIPPLANQATTYAVNLSIQNRGSQVAGGTVTTVLPSYVSYTGITTGNGSFSYNEASHTVTWSVGDISQLSASGSFQVSLTPSTSQNGSAPALTGPFSFSGFDRFAGVQVQTRADPVTTETKGDPGYTSANSIVH